MLRKLVIPVLVVAAALAGAAFMVVTRPVPEVAEPVVPTPLVRVRRAAATDLRLDVRSQGTVMPRTEASLVAEVSGRIVWTAPAFEQGGFFSRGDTLARLDDRDYELDRAAAEAQVAQARVRLAREEAEAQVAAEEWRELGDGGDAGPLVLREPQLEEARALLQAAEAALARAELALERTRVRAPWDGRVREVLADVGQFVGGGTPIARLHSVDYAEVRLPVADQDLRFLELPLTAREGDLAQGPGVVLEADFAGGRERWTGRVVRAEGELDAQTRMMSLVARVEDPYRRAAGAEGGAPLPVGLFVEATVEGKVARGVIELPRAAMRGDDRVLVVDADRRLRWRRVEVLRRTRETVVLAGGVSEGEAVCVSPLDAPVDGMVVQPLEEPAAAVGGVAEEAPDPGVEGSPSAGR